MDDRTTELVSVLVQALQDTGYEDLDCQDPIRCGTFWGVCPPCSARSALNHAKEAFATMTQVQMSEFKEPALVYKALCATIRQRTGGTRYLKAYMRRDLMEAEAILRELLRRCTDRQKEVQQESVEQNREHGEQVLRCMGMTDKDINAVREMNSQGRSEGSFTPGPTPGAGDVLHGGGTPNGFHPQQPPLGIPSQPVFGE